MQFQDYKGEHLDTFINYIKQFNLNIQLGLRESRLTKQFTQKLKTSLKDFQKFIVDYNRKNVNQIKKARLLIPPIIFRKTLHLINNDDFMKFQQGAYTLKYIFSKSKDSQFLTNVQIYRNNGGLKESCLAFQKFQQLLINDLSHLIVVVPQNENTLIQFLQSQARRFLQQVNKIMLGQKCAKCKTHLTYSKIQQIFMPPTVRFFQYQHYHQKDYDYYHQSCI